MIASGTFNVNLEPLDARATGEDGIALGRMSIDKVFTGDLEATSQGEMLSASTPVDGSAGYVALEQVTGALHERPGSFVLQHFGVMHAGENRLILEVVPGSGSGALVGLSGSMSLEIVDGVHRYALDYSLAGER